MINIQIYPTIQEVIVETAILFFSSAAEEIQKKDVFNVALSGGNTPQPLFEFLGTDPSGDFLDWQKIHFFWSDERTVPPDHPDSNFRQAYSTLLLPRQIPPDHIHRIKGELEPEAAALDAQQELAGYFQSNPHRIPLPWHKSCFRSPAKSMGSRELSAAELLLENYFHTRNDK